MSIYNDGYNEDTATERVSYVSTADTDSRGKVRLRFLGWQEVVLEGKRLLTPVDYAGGSRGGVTYITKHPTSIETTVEREFVRRDRGTVLMGGHVGIHPR
jgi:hypothetical protein